MGTKSTKPPKKPSSFRGTMRPFKPAEIRLLEAQLFNREMWRDLALLRAAHDSMLRASDVVCIRVDDLTDHNGRLVQRGQMIMQKTGKPVRYTLTKDTQEAIQRWLAVRPAFSGEWLFPGRDAGTHLSVVQYRKIVKGWVKLLGLPPRHYSTHSLRRTRATQIYRETHNLKAVSVLLGHADTTVTSRYLGIEQEDALDLAEKVKI